MNELHERTPPPLLEVHQLVRRTSGGTVLLENISLSVFAGERLAIVGKTGSGKTVLLRCLARLDPCEGEIRWNGREVSETSIPHFRSQVMYLPQASPGLEGTVLDNLLFPFSLGIHGTNQFSKDAVLHQMRQLGKSEDFLQRTFSELSGGERQILAFLRALQLAPQILLLDEASSALDPRSEVVFEQLVEEWLKDAPESRAVIWVSHDETQRRRVSDREFHLERRLDKKAER